MVRLRYTLKNSGGMERGRYAPTDSDVSHVAQTGGWLDNVAKRFAAEAMLMLALTNYILKSLPVKHV